MKLPLPGLRSAEDGTSTYESDGPLNRYALPPDPGCPTVTLCRVPVSLVEPLGALSVIEAPELSSICHKAAVPLAARAEPVASTAATAKAPKPSPSLRTRTQPPSANPESILHQPPRSTRWLTRKAPSRGGYDGPECSPSGRARPWVRLRTARAVRGGARRARPSRRRVVGNRLSYTNRLFGVWWRL